MELQQLTNIESIHHLICNMTEKERHNESNREDYSICKNQ